MIVTLTPNPSLDRTMVVDHLTRGAVIRAEHNWVEPAGKGVNISRALGANGIATTAVFPSGGSNGDELCRLLTASGVTYKAVPISGQVRSNVSVVEPDGAVTKLNEAGPTLTSAEVDDLVAAVVAATSDGGWIAASGSLAPGMSEDFYCRLARRVGDFGAKLAVDSSGGALRAALAGAPDLVKPNRHELGELLDRSIRTLGEVVEAASAARRRGADQVLVSLGPDGAVLVDEAGAIHGEVAVDQVRNTVGAGDALLAGFLAGGGSGRAALANALAWARASVRSPMTLMAPPDEADHAAVTILVDIDSDRTLEDDESSTGAASKSTDATAGVASPANSQIGREGQ